MWCAARRACAGASTWNSSPRPVPATSSSYRHSCRTRRSMPAPTSRWNVWSFAATTRPWSSTSTSTRSRSRNKCCGSIRSTKAEPPRQSPPGSEKLFRDRCPFFLAAIEQRLLLVLGPISAIAFAKTADAAARAFDRLVAQPDQRAFDRPHVAGREAPIITAHTSEMVDAISGDTAGEVDVGVEVAQSERPGRAEHRLAPVQAGIARARDRAPAAVLPVDEDHVVEEIERLEAHDQRRIAVLLQQASGKQRGFETMGGMAPHDLTEAAQRARAGRRLGVVGEPVQVILHLRRRAQARNQAPLGRREGGER